MKGKPLEATAECVDRYDECQGFVDAGECSNNPGWMIINCARSCDACDLRDPKIRCTHAFMNVSDQPTFRPGDMESMFKRIISDYSEKYDVKILSRSPWVVTFENFLSDEEVSALLETVDGWERSTDTGQSNEFGETGRVLSEGRTSSNAW